MKIVLKPESEFTDWENSEVGILVKKTKALGKFVKNETLNKTIKTTMLKFANKSLQTRYEHIPAGNGSCIVYAVSENPGLDEKEIIRLSGHSLFKYVKARSATNLVLFANNTTPTEFTCMLEGIYLGLYQFEEFKSKPKPMSIKQITIIINKKALRSYNSIAEKTRCIFQGVSQCRDLVNTPGSDLTPEKFSRTAGNMAKKAGLSIEIKNAAQLKKEGFNGLPVVGKGSSNPPQMVTLTYKGAGRKKSPHIVLVGKGVTFDTGGISLKPGAGMWEMKCDMAGAATVLNTIYVCALLNLKINVSAVLVLAENRPGQNAVLPGDIFKAKNGKTVMVENTDAEGRLVLSDGLAQAGILKATHIIDLATLTGAIVRALGTSYTGLFSNDAKMARRLISAGKEEGEKFWEMPLEEEYQSQIKDTTADIKNLAKPEGSAITAALFLQEFVPENTSWTHLDIAATAFVTSNWKYYTPGATGWGIKTLVSVIESMGK